MSNPYKMTFTLKQHTPLIHFQHDQEGATLRATEVKPKLDRFIMEREIGCNPNYETTKDTFKKLHQDWIIGGDRAANISLNYKCRIIAKGDPEIFMPFSFLTTGQYRFFEDRNEKALAPAPYFANNQFLSRTDEETNWDEMRGAIMHKELIFEITCIIPSLLIAIEKSIVNFFNSTNFGTRNSKGFGGFEVVAKNGVALKRDVTNQPEFWRNIPDLLAVYQCELDFENPNEIFKSINEQYQVLKSGLNPPGRYIKSILFQYFASKRIKWEKRWIKHALNQAGIMNIIEQGELPLNADCHNNWDQEVHEQFEYKYIRALFGLAEHNDYKKRIPGKPFKIKIKNGIHGNGIERSKSPLTIKVIQNKIFILVFPVSPLMLNQPFTFSFDTNNHQTQSQNIHTPDEFDIVEFMDFATNLINKVSSNQDPRPPDCKDDLDKLKLKYKRLI